jgi:hypothetical protein
MAICFLILGSIFISQMSQFVLTFSGHALPSKIDPEKWKFNILCYSLFSGSQNPMRTRRERSENAAASGPARDVAVSAWQEPL